MDYRKEVSELIPTGSKEFIEEVATYAIKKEFPPHTELIKDGYYVKVLPFVIEGLIKVFTKYEDKDLLLYYITRGETCIMSFSSGMNNEPSQIYAITETDTTALLFPIDKVMEWVKKFPEFNILLFQQYGLRYRDLRETIHLVLFNNMEQRLHNYLAEKAAVQNSTTLKISHKQIAAELGTAREVVSRVMKKLEHEGIVKQKGSSIIVKLL